MTDHVHMLVSIPPKYSVAEDSVLSRVKVREGLTPPDIGLPQTYCGFSSSERLGSRFS